MKTLSTLLFSTCFLLIGCAGSSTDTTSPNIDVITFDKMRAKANTVVLDVRTAEEIAEGMVEGAQMIDFYSDQFDAELAKLDKSKTYLVYCRSGNRSGKTLEKMKALKFEKSFHLVGGYAQWSKENGQ